MSSERPEEFPSIWGNCNIEFYTAVDIPEYKDRDQKIHRPHIGESFCGVKAKFKIVRTNQYLRPETVLQKTFVIYVDRNDKQYKPLAANVDAEGWVYFIYSIPTGLFPPKSVMFALPQANA
jgi:hypothetical protein